MGRWLRALSSDLMTGAGRFHVVQSLLRRFPGQLGTELRSQILGRRFRRAGKGLQIYEGAHLMGVQNLSVGENCWIGFESMIQANGGVELGDNVMLGPGVKIWSVNHVFADPDKPVLEQGYEYKPVVIGSNVWIGANAFVMPGARLGDGVVVSAGSVVAGKEVEPYAILAGNPARKIGTRTERGGVARREND